MKALEALWEEARAGKPEWRNVELNRNREDVRNRIKEFADEEYNRLEKEKNKKGEWHMGWGINRELEIEKCETIVEHRRRCTSKFLRNIWGERREEQEGEVSGGGNRV